MNFIFIKNISIAHILFVLGISAIIALSTFSLFFQSIRLDESQSIWLSVKSFFEILNLTAQDVHVPLYGVILHYWMQLFGADIFVARSLSFLFYVATIPALYILARETANKQVAYVTTLFFALSPFILWYSFEARTYSLLTLMATLSHLFFMRMIRSNAENGKAGFFLSLVVGLYTHYFFLLVVFMQAVYVAVLYIQRLLHDLKETSGSKLQQITRLAALQTNTPEKKISLFRYAKHAFVHHKKLILSYAIAVASAFVLFAPWLIYVVSLGSASNTQPLVPAPSTFNLIQTFVLFMFGFQNQEIQSILVSLWPVSIILLFIVFTKRRKLAFKNIEYFALATFLPVALVFLVSYIKPVFLSRYLIFLAPTMFLLLSWTLLSFSKKIRYTALIGYTAISLSLLTIQITSAQTTVKEDYRGVGAYLSSQTDPSDIIGVSAPFTVYPIEYSYTGNSRIDTIPQWNRFKEGQRIPAFSQTELEKQVENYQKQYDELYVVLSYDQGYEDDIRTYLDSRFQLTSTKSFSNGIIVRSYKMNYNPKISIK
ncbi:MAG: glycosyltransferase family 39 protein [Candidatus Levybacteria bacterium]|nr:glycosyltransferase family 39 protein [Candidatus Levybacteria bacterium]